ncbi:MAG: MFS transporter [Melioribacteraceae bacterium]|nr:MFS transporter [Melioribacteraceae bacterium]
MGFGILIPILPTFASKLLDISDFGIGLIVAIYSLVQFLFNPVLGKISDNFGRKPIIIVSLLITSISYLMFSFSESFLILFLSRMLGGLGGSNIGVAQAYIADITTKSERSRGMGLIGAAFGLGFVFGPLVGGLLSEYGYAFAGYASAAFSFTAMLFAIFFLPESNLKKTRGGRISFRIFDPEELKSTFKLPSVGLLLVLFFIIIFSIANIYGTFALLGFKKFGFTDIQNGYLFGLMGIVSSVVQGGLLKRLSVWFRAKYLILIGLLFMMSGLGLIPYGINFTGVAIAGAVLNVGTGILQPTILSLISSAAPENKQGTILGINQSFSALARVLGPLWGGIAFEFIGYEFPFLTGAVFTLITLLITIKFLNKDTLENSDV